MFYGDFTKTGDNHIQVFYTQRAIIGGMTCDKLPSQKPPRSNQSANWNLLNDVEYNRADVFDAHETEHFQ